MKLLLDENLSDRIVPRILDLFPGSVHVKDLGLIRTDDTLIWDLAREQGFTIASKDSDFHQRCILFGAPPRLIFLRVGNCATSVVTDILRDRCDVIREFLDDPESSLLVFERD